MSMAPHPHHLLSLLNRVSGYEDFLKSPGFMTTPLDAAGLQLSSASSSAWVQR